MSMNILQREMVNGLNERRMSRRCSTCELMRKLYRLEWIHFAQVHNRALMYDLVKQIGLTVLEVNQIEVWMVLTSLICLHKVAGVKAKHLSTAIVKAQ